MDFDFNVVMGYLIRLLIAFGLAPPLGWERGSGRSSLGFRMLPIVARQATAATR